MTFITHLLDRYSFRLLLLHGVLGLILSQYVIISTIWGWSIVIVGIYYISKYRNRYNAAGLFAAYLVGMEIVLRMTNAGVLWELGKYGVIAMLTLGMAMENIRQHRTSLLIILYFLCLLPSVILVPFENFNLWRQLLSFNLSGPLCLFVSFLYFRNRLVSDTDLIRLLRIILLPLMTMSVILIIRTPPLEDIVFSSEASFQMSGGYGPNQVSSALGFVVAVIAMSKILGYRLFNKDIYDYLILGICSIQAYLTFARGGVLTAILAILSTWLISLGQDQSKILRTGKIVYISIILLILWDIAGDFTRGKMEKRYLSMLNLGESGELSGSGRMLIMASDLEIFFDNLLLGVGPGVASAIRANYSYGKFVIAHSEFTRALAEHGLFGLISLTTLILLSYKESQFRIKREKCILACFTSIAILTMFHSAMRLAIPGFVFGFAFLKLKLTEYRS